MLKRIVTVLAIWLIVLGICCSVSQAEGTYEFPDGVTIIDDYAFYGSTAVKEVVLPEGLLRLGVQCFAYSSLTQVTLPDTLEFIADDAFEGCSALTVSATEGTYAYEWAVDNGYVQEDMPEPSPIEDFQYQIKNGQATITKYIGSNAYVVIPPVINDCPVTQIGVKCFSYNDAIVSVYIPNSVTTIGAEAFRASNLISVSIPNSVTTIGYSAFYGTNLTSITIPRNIDTIEYHTFAGCDSLVSLTIPNNVKTLKKEAFAYCDNLTSVTLEKGLTTIGEGAFRSCTNLTRINIPDSVTTIGSSAFSDCANLISVTIPGSVKSIASSTFNQCNNLANLTIENGVVSIDMWAFNSCKNLTTLVLPSSLTTIGNGAFTHCTNLASVTIPSSVTHMEEKAFANCSSLSSLTIEDGVTSIGNYAFSGCSSLAHITIPKSIAKIADGAFDSCSNLANVTIEKGASVIGTSAFFNCPNLSNIKIPNTIVSIGDSAFRGCTKLTSITLPQSVVKIGFWAFSVSGLTSITIPGSIASLDRNVFEDCSKLESVIFEKGVISISNGAFINCTSLSRVVIPNSVISIGESAFSLCTNLRSVTIPDSVTSIGESAFSSCKNLTSITIPANVYTIGDYVFNSVPNVTICTSYGSTAHKYAQSKNIPCIFYNTTTPGVTPETAPDAYLYYKIHHTFSIDGATYYEAELLKAYNGVAPSDDYAIRTFYMDAQQHVVTDASVLCKLYTLSMYVNGEASINSLLSTWKTTSQTCSSTATKFLTDKQLFNSLGAAAGDVVNALTIKSVTWLAGIKDLVNTLTDAGQAEAILLMVDIKNYSSHLSEMTDYTSNIPVCINGGAYDYDLVNIKLQYYAYCRTCYKLVQGMCMPVIDKITQNYASSWDLAFDHLTTFCFSFAETFVPSINEGLAWTGPAIKGIGMVVQNDFSATNILSELFSVASVTVKDYVWKDVDSIATITDLASGLLNIVTGSVANLCNFHGMDQSEYDAFKAPYYITTEEMRDTTLYKNHQLLAQPLS